MDPRKLRKQQQEPTTPPANEFAPQQAPRDAEEEAATPHAHHPHHERPLPSEHGPLPLPGRDEVEEPADGE